MLHPFQGWIKHNIITNNCFALCLLKEQSPGNFNVYKDKIKTYLNDDDAEKILQFAVDLGFDPQWLCKVPKVKKQTPGLSFKPPYKWIGLYIYITCVWYDIYLYMIYIYIWYTYIYIIYYIYIIICICKERVKHAFGHIMYINTK